METSKARPCREMDLVLYLLSVSHLLRVPPNSSSVFPPVPLPLRRYFAGALSSSFGTPKGNHRPCGSLFSLTGLGNRRVYLGAISACWPGGGQAGCLCACQGTGPHGESLELQFLPLVLMLHSKWFKILPKISRKKKKEKKS